MIRKMQFTRGLRWLPVIGMLLLGAGCSQSAPVVDKPKAFWPAYPDSPHIQFLTSYSFSRDVVPPRNAMDQVIMGKAEEQVLPINKPYGVRMWDGKIYVCDTQNVTVTILDLRKKEVRLMGTSGPGQVAKPIDIAITDDGIKYVADTVRAAVIVYGRDDAYVTQFKHEDFKPTALAIYKDELFASNMATGKVEVLDRHNGKLLRTIGTPGRGQGQFMAPLGLAVDASGNVFVGDMLGCKVQKFSHDGKFLMSMGSLGDRPGSFTRPKHLAVDAEGILYIVDAAFQNVQMFDAKGQELLAFGASGEFPGAMELPAGIAIHEGDMDLFAQYIHPAFDAKRLILVTNQFGNAKVSVYALGELKRGTPWTKWRHRRTWYRWA